MGRLDDHLRRAVLASGQTRYRIGKDSGVSGGQLSRLVNRERGLTIDTAERLAEYLGYEIVLRLKPSKER